MPRYILHCGQKVKSVNYYRADNYKGYGLLELWSAPCSRFGCGKNAIGYRLTDIFGAVIETERQTTKKLNQIYQSLINLGTAVPSSEPTRQERESHRQTKGGMRGVSNWTRRAASGQNWQYILRVARTVFGLKARRFKVNPMKRKPEKWIQPPGDALTGREEPAEVEPGG